VIGIGLNLQRGDALWAGITPGALPPAALADLAASAPDRNALVAAIAAQCAAGLSALQRDGFASRRAEWNAADALAGRSVTVSGAGTEPLSGIARGIDAGGALQIEQAGRVQAIVAGDVSLRVQA
jgi:BirA family biotin operon repressor/biotin-[acetyl-CoA-carboxylase] ligase